MKKKIAILGSTGSIGKTLLNIISKDKSNFEIILLTAKKSYKSLLSQANIFKVKNLIITDVKSYQKALSATKYKKINIFNNFDHFNKIFKKKLDYTMSSIIGLDGLLPTIRIIKYTKNIAIANKEAIICGWDLINKQLKKNKTNFLPVDSEHFSIWKIIKFNTLKNIDKIFITASGGPFLDKTHQKIKDAKITDALNHPNWKMGKKISIDSATMMNKVFEVIETRNIFDTPYKKIFILIHPSSYIHAIVKFNDGTSHLVAHDTSMKIPIFNTLYNKQNKEIKTTDLNIKKLNNLNFRNIDKTKFPIINILKLIPQNTSLYETILVTSNDEFVNLFLKNKIKFHEISKNLLKFIKLKEFQKFRYISPKNIHDIQELSDYVRLKINSLSI
jgi:1-deoxy-D-xylulose-5-phosphate reductoisomerase